MTETQIAETLKQNITPPQDTVLAPSPELDTSNGQATVLPETKLDEMTSYKLHDLLGATYKESDTVSKQQIEYIHTKISELIDSTDYILVAGKIRELERMIGTSDKPDRIYRLYQWLKLDSARRNIESQMEIVSHDN